MRLGVVIVTFNPQFNILKKNIEFLSKYDINIVVVDNNSNNFSSFNSEEKVHFVRESKNVGIAKALNDGVKYLHRLDTDWVLTLDQDSILDDEYFDEFFNLKFSENVSVYYPIIIDRNKDKSEQLKKIGQSKSGIRLPIQSGAFIKISDYYLIGGMDESLFIDGVDFDFFLMLLTKGKKIVPLKSTYVYHQLGNITAKKFLGRKIYITNHSPIRYYYNYRNMPIVINRYKKSLSEEEVGKGFKSFFNYEHKRTIKMILFEQQRFAKLKNMFKGYHDKNNLSIERKNYM